MFLFQTINVVKKSWSLNLLYSGLGKEAQKLSWVDKVKLYKAKAGPRQLYVRLSQTMKLYNGTLRSVYSVSLSWSKQIPSTAALLLWPDLWIKEQK